MRRENWKTCGHSPFWNHLGHLLITTIDFILLTTMPVHSIDFHTFPLHRLLNSTTLHVVTYVQRVGRKVCFPSNTYVHVWQHSKLLYIFGKISNIHGKLIYLSYISFLTTKYNKSIKKFWQVRWLILSEAAQRGTKLIHTCVYDDIKKCMQQNTRIY